MDILKLLEKRREMLSSDPLLEVQNPSYAHTAKLLKEPEPIAYAKFYEFGAKMVPKDFPGAVPLYTRPITVELTEDAILECVEDHADFQYFHPNQFIDFARAVEKKLKGIK